MSKKLLENFYIRSITFLPFISVSGYNFFTRHIFKKFSFLNFSEFFNNRITNAWEQRKLGALLDEYKVSIPTPHDGYTRLGIRSHAKGTFHEYVPKGRELETKEMKKVAKDK